MTGPAMPLPREVTPQQWRQALADLLVAEKALTRQRDDVSALRRRLPMVRITEEYGLDGVDGPARLLDLFDGRRQLIVYHFMFGSDWDQGCSGCSWVVDAMSHPAHLHARDTSLVLVSRADIATIHRFRRRMGWDLPWYSSAASTFNVDFGATVDGEEHHGVSVFLREGDAIFRTYYSGARGVEHLGSHWTYLDLTPFGRQELWEDSPDGWPQSEPYEWLRHHDSY